MLFVVNLLFLAGFIIESKKGRKQIAETCPKLAVVKKTFRYCD